MWWAYVHSTPGQHGGSEEAAGKKPCVTSQMGRRPLSKTRGRSGQSRKWVHLAHRGTRYPVSNLGGSSAWSSGAQLESYGEWVLGCRANYHRLQGLNHRSLFSPGLGGWKSMISMSPALLPSEDRGEESVPASLPGLSCFAGSPSPLWPRRCIAPTSVMLTWCFPVCVSVSRVPPYGDTVIGFGPVLVRSDLILTRLSSETPFPSKVTFTGLGGQDSQRSWGHSSAYKRDHGPQVDSPALARPIRGDRQEQKVRGCPDGVQRLLLLKPPSPKQGFCTLVGL